MLNITVTPINYVAARIYKSMKLTILDVASSKRGTPTVATKVPYFLFIDVIA